MCWVGQSRTREMVVTFWKSYRLRCGDRYRWLARCVGRNGSTRAAHNSSHWVGVGVPLGARTTPLATPIGVAAIRDRFCKRMSHPRGKEKLVPLGLPHVQRTAGRFSRVPSTACAPCHRTSIVDLRHGEPVAARSAWPTPSVPNRPAVDTVRYATLLQRARSNRCRTLVRAGRVAIVERLSS